jgi:hypothetical protein
MKVTLTKNIELCSAQVYLRFEKEEERKDIQDYLNGKKQFEPLIENRIKDYLKNIGVFDERYQLTKYGNNIKSTGKMFVSEEGKYQIWFTNNDSHFENKIFYFKRVQPSRDSSEGKLELRLDDDGHFLLPTENNSYTKLKLLPTKGYFGQNGNKESIFLTWIWDNLKKSHYIFSGQLGSKDKTIKNEEIPSDKDIQKIISDILPDWNNEQKRYAIRFDGLSEQIRTTFEDKNYTSKWNNFDIQIHNLPLMPYDLEEAKKWQDCLLNQELESNYLSPSDFEETAMELNEKKALSSFNLTNPHIKDFTQKTSSKKAFWHLSAPSDLNPNTRIKLTTKPVELRKGDKISFADIVARLGINDNSVFIYYDRYVVNEKQQRAVSALTKAVNSTKKIIITDLTPKENSSDFIKKNVSEIKLRDSTVIFSSKTPHDRYLIIADKGEITIWNISNSIDYISFSERNIDKDTTGTIRQSVVFTPISKEMLDKDLLNFINNETKNDN